VKVKLIIFSLQLVDRGSDCSMSVSEDVIIITGTASLVIQIVVLALLVYGATFISKTKFRKHGIIMSTAIILHLVMIFAIMIPSFILAVVPGYIVPMPLEVISLISLVHGVTGVASMILGVGLVGAWRFNKEVTGCFKRKPYMLWTRAVWIIALILGIVIYAFFYGPLLFG
jgi:uncharacterized membrane protein YozB (DUF420 family)